MVLKQSVTEVQKLWLSSCWIALGLWILPVNAQVTSTAGERLGTNAVGPHPNDAPVPDDGGQSGVKGDMVPSIKGLGGEKHFVSPKQTGDFVRLRAQIPHDLDAQFSTYFEWVKPKDPDDSTKDVGFADGSFFNVPRDKPGKYTVQVRTKGTGTVTTVDKINVWIVWATIKADPNLDTFNDDGQRLFMKGGYNFTHTILPPEIIDQSADVPNLTGANDTLPPGTVNSCNQNLAGGADKHWDNSRQARERYIVSNGYPPTCRDQKSEDYPTDESGNDDTLQGDETNDPYSNQGILQASDHPGRWCYHNIGSDNDTVEMRLQFREFTRLEIKRKWYRISDYFPWRLHLKFQKVSGKWTKIDFDKAKDNNLYNP